jgi:SAM-dependent methyltransferase
MRGPVGRALEHPLTRGLDLDSPETTALRRQIILSKPFLRSLYLDWYRSIESRIPDAEGAILEVGAGGGFLEQEIPELITTEIFNVPGIRAVVDAQKLPFASDSFRAIVMTNVFHHIPDVTLFLDEAERILIPGGRIIMVEPWNTAMSRIMHERFHDEPMLPESPSWKFPTSGPLSGANAALPWIVVQRDRERLETQWGFSVLEAEPFMPFRYLVSGGVSLRSLQPGWMYPIWKWIDSRRLFKRLAVFALIVLERE